MDLTEHAELSEQIIRSSDEAIFSKTLDGTITSWNPAAERLFGYKPEEAIGQDVRMLAVGDAGIAEIADILRRVARGEKVDHQIVERKTQDGRLIRVSLTISPMRDASNVPIGASVIVHEAGPSERQMAEMRLMVQAAMGEAAQTRDLAKGVSSLRGEVSGLSDALAGVGDQLVQFETTDEIEKRMAGLEKTVNQDMKKRLGDTARRLVKTIVVGVLIAVLIAGGLFYYGRVTGCFARNRSNQVLRDIVDRSETQQQFDVTKLSPESRKVLAEIQAASPPRDDPQSFGSFVHKHAPIKGNCWNPI